MNMLAEFFSQLWQICLEASPWLLLGLVVSGLIKVWLPTRLLQRLVGGVGVWPVLKAAVIGTPLPLCSCSVIPAAVALRRSGASRGSTVSFLVSTPENGADSIALTYALLGPFMTIARPIAAIFSAVTAGLLASNVSHEQPSQADALERETTCGDSCCGCGPTADDAGPGDEQASEQTRAGKLARAYRFTVDELFGDIAAWLALGLVLAALMNTVVPPDAMAGWGSGVLVMLAVMAAGVPMYICATASTPVAASMMLAGMSPGTVLVFLLAGPATNLATIGVVRRELGTRAVCAYLAGVCGCSLLAGLFVDWLVDAAGITISPTMGAGQELIPGWIAYAAFAVLAAMSARLLFKFARRRSAAARSASAPGGD